MYYKIKKISNISSTFQVNLFRHYRRLLAPLNPVGTIFQNWLTLISLLLLGFAILNSTFVIFGLALLWLIIPITKTFLWYTPISLTFWILSISLLTSLHSLKICFSLPKEFRLLLLIEQGLSIKMFFNKSSNTEKKIGLILTIIGILFFMFPKYMVILVWIMPLFIEYYCLAGLTNAFLSKNLSTMPTQTLATLLGFEYNYLQTQPNNFNFFSNDLSDDWVSEETENLEESFMEEEDQVDLVEPPDDFYEFNADYDIEQEDFEDEPSHSKLGSTFERPLSFEIEYIQQRKRFYNYQLPNRDEVLQDYDSQTLRKKFPEFFQLQDISLDLKFQYTKVPLLYRYLHARKKIQTSSQEKQNLLNYQPIETRLWSGVQLNLNVLRLPTNSPWYNSGFPQLFDNLFSDYEDISDFILESHAVEDDFDITEEPDQEIANVESNDFSLWGNEEEVYNEPGMGDEYKAPNWFWLSFCYYTIFFWFILNFLLLCFFLICGIPETWVLSHRVSASNNILIYKILLNMTEQLYTKWGFTKMPVGGYSRIEYFNYMQPSYFRRIPKFYKKLVSFRFGPRYNSMMGWWSWEKFYKRRKIYGIAQGTSFFHKDPKYSTFDTFLFRKHSSMRWVDRSRLSQNVGFLYLNNEFFVKKDQQVLNFYRIMETYNKK